MTPFEDQLVDREILEKLKATPWQLFRARLFGNRVYYKNGKLMGWWHKGIVFVTCDPYGDE